MPGERVKSIVDYTDTHIVIVMDDGDMIPGRAFKVHKKTGKAEPFNPTEDPDGFFEAAEKRSIIF